MIPKRLVLFGCACLTAVMLWPANASAQFYVGVGVGWGHYYRPYYPFYGYGYYRPFYSPFYSPFYGFYGGWYPFYGGYGYAPYYYGGNWSSARIEVKPVQASVYVDGYFVGEVDRFDGVFQRLDLPTGEHEIAVYLPGHRTYRERTLFRPGASYHFKAALEPLPAGTPDEPAPKPDPRVRGRDQSGDPQDPRYRGEPREPSDPRDPYGPPPQDPRRTQPPPDRPGDRRGDRAPESGDFGTLTVRVQPANAVVIIDGERWDSPEGGSRLIVQLVGGQHRIEVRKEGFKPYTATVQIRPGETQSLNISLPPAGGGS